MMFFFDLDGTLLDSNGLWEQIDRDFLAARGLTVTPEYSYAMGHSIFPVAARFTVDYYHLPESPEAIMGEWQDMAYAAYARTLPLKPGARALLEKQRSLGRPMALLTAGVPALAKAALARHGLTEFFSGLFFAQEAGLEKRDPEVYRLAARHFGVSPDRCTLLEDAPENCAAARSAGYTVIGVYDDFYRAQWPSVVRNSHLAVRSLEALL